MVESAIVRISLPYYPVDFDDNAMRSYMWRVSIVAQVYLDYHTPSSMWYRGENDNGVAYGALISQQSTIPRPMCTCNILLESQDDGSFPDHFLI
eukprot:scaffold65712_cov64-Attheya_sp.AAC.2